MATLVEQVLQTLQASQQVTATPQQRSAAVQLFEQVGAAAPPAAVPARMPGLPQR